MEENSNETTSVEDLIIAGGTVDKSLTGSAIKRQSFKNSAGKKIEEWMIAVSAKVEGEDDFINIFSGDRISTTGGVGLTFGLGNLPSELKSLTDSRVTDEPKEKYWMLYFSLFSEFVKLENVEDPNCLLYTSPSPRDS